MQEDLDNIILMFNLHREYKFLTAGNIIYQEFLEEMSKRSESEHFSAEILCEQWT